MPNTKDHLIFYTTLQLSSWKLIHQNLSKYLKQDAPEIQRSSHNKTSNSLIRKLAELLLRFKFFQTVNIFSVTFPLESVMRSIISTS